MSLSDFLFMHFYFVFSAPSTQFCTTPCRTNFANPSGAYWLAEDLIPPVNRRPQQWPQLWPLTQSEGPNPETRSTTKQTQTAAVKR